MRLKEGTLHGPCGKSLFALAGLWLCIKKFFFFFYFFFLPFAHDFEPNWTVNCGAANSEPPAEVLPGSSEMVLHLIRGGCEGCGLFV